MGQRNRTRAYLLRESVLKSEAGACSDAAAEHRKNIKADQAFRTRMQRAIDADLERGIKTPPPPPPKVPSELEKYHLAFKRLRSRNASSIEPTKSAKGITWRPAVDSRLGIIIEAVCSAFGVTRLQILSRRREERISKARQTIMYFAREYTALSFPSIGRGMGGMDHTTVLHGASAMAALLARGPVKSKETALVGLIEATRTELLTRPEFAQDPEPWTEAAE